MKKYLDHIMTAAFVSMLVAILFIVVMPGEKGKAVDATDGCFKDIIVNPAIVKQNGAFEVKFKNNSGSVITDLSIEADLGSNLTPDKVSKKQISSLNNGEEGIAKFDFLIKSTAKEGEASATFTISGKISGNDIDPVVITHNYVIVFETPTVELSSADNYKSIRPLSDDTISIKIKNTDTTKIINNVRIVCDSGFEANSNLTRGYIGAYVRNEEKTTVNPLDDVTIKVPFKVGADITKGVHELVFHAEYEDAIGSYASEPIILYVEYKASAVKEETTEGIPYEPVKGYTFEEEIKPGKTTHVRTMITNYNSGAVGESQFDSFVLETSDERIVTSGLTLTDSSTKTLYYPNSNNSNNGYRNSYTGFGTYILEFDVSCADTIEKGKYKVTFYGVTLYDQNGYTPTTINQGDIVKPTRYPLISFNINNDSEAKSATVGIDKISYDKKNMMPASSNQFAVTIKNTGTTDISELYLVTELGDSLTPDYEMKKLRVGALSAGSTTTYKVPFTVKSSAVSGNTEVTFKLSGVDKYGRPVEETNETLFVRIGAGEATVDAPSLTLSTKQNYKLLVPSTDDSVIIRITNNGSRVAKNVRLSCEKGFGVGEGLTKSYTTSYIAVDDIPAGKTVKVEVPFLVGAGFGKGIHELEFSATYLDEDKHDYKTDLMTMYVEH
jgi:hypothetical protein